MFSLVICLFRFCKHTVHEIMIHGFKNEKWNNKSKQKGKEIEKTWQ